LIGGILSVEIEFLQLRLVEINMIS